MVHCDNFQGQDRYYAHSHSFCIDKQKDFRIKQILFHDKNITSKSLITHYEW